MVSQPRCLPQSKANRLNEVCGSVSRGRNVNQVREEREVEEFNLNTSVYDDTLSAVSCIGAIDTTRSSCVSFIYDALVLIQKT